MVDSIAIVKSAVKEMEGIQAQVGAVQINLLQILTDDQLDEWDDTVQEVLVKLEGIQRSIGEIQVEIFQRLRTVEGPAPEPSPSAPPARSDDCGEDDEQADSGTDCSTRQGPGTETEPMPFVPASDWTDPRAWLEGRGIQVKAVLASSGLDAAADRAALYLGDNYATLAGFWRHLKRTVSSEYKNLWFSVKGLSPGEIAPILQFGNRLKACCFLSEFFLVKKNQCLRVQPLEDGRVQGFFTGGWLERYTVQLVKQVCREAAGTDAGPFLLHGVKVTLPEDGDAEFDLLLGCSGRRVLWLECKTGAWQNYVTRLREINDRHLRLPSTQAGLLLLDPLAPEDKQSAETLSGLTVLHLGDLRDWVAGVLGGREVE